MMKDIDEDLNFAIVFKQLKRLYSQFDDAKKTSKTTKKGTRSLEEFQRERKN